MPQMTLPDGDHLHYETTGTGPALVLISGLTGLAAFWQPHVAILARAFTVITHDHRGCGHSAKPAIDYSVEQMTGDVIALMDHLEIERAHVVGHSTGGVIGQVMAIDYPDRLDRLVISASWPGKDPYFDLLFDTRARVLTNFGPGEYLRHAALVMRTPEWLAANPDETLLPGAEMIRTMVADVDCTLRRIDAIRRFDRRHDLHRITAPTLISAATGDLVTPLHLSMELSRLIPHASLDIVSNAGHLYPLTHPETFRAAIVPFLQAS